MVARISGFASGSGFGGVFTDDERIADYAKDAVYTLRDKGVLNGKGENEFAPTDTATRAEAAMLLYRISKNR